MNDLVTIISTVGFPIVACLGLGYYINSFTKAQREDSKAREDKLFEQIEKFSESLGNFNETLKKLDNKIANIEDTLTDKKGVA